MESIRCRTLMIRGMFADFTLLAVASERQPGLAQGSGDFGHLTRLSEPFREQITV